jgi:hypothetical protein
VVRAVITDVRLVRSFCTALKPPATPAARQQSGGHAASGRSHPPPPRQVPPTDEVREPYYARMTVTILQQRLVRVHYARWTADLGGNLLQRRSQAELTQVLIFELAESLRYAETKDHGLAAPSEELGITSQLALIALN